MVERDGLPGVTHANIAANAPEARRSPDRPIVGIKKGLQGRVTARGHLGPFDLLQP